MNILSKLTTTAALALLSLAAQADTICKDCEYTYWGSYLGAYWPKDHGTFGNRDILANFVELGFPNARGFDDYWIFDLYDTSVVSLTINGGKLGATIFAVEIYADTGSVCYDYSSRCTISIPAGVTTPIMSQFQFDPKRLSSTTVLPPGRYAIRIAVDLYPTTSESEYRGTFTVRAVK